MKVKKETQVLDSVVRGQHQTTCANSR